MSFLLSDENEFKITVEVVPPGDDDYRDLLAKLSNISRLGFHGFSVATNPVARPRMSAMAFSHLLQKETGKPAILHFTVRDHNRLGLQAELWGAKALGIDTVIAVTGDPSAARQGTTSVNDVNVYELIRMGWDSGLATGAVLDFRPERNGLAGEVKRLEKKAAAGAKFIVTQPIYDRETALAISGAIRHIRVPKLMGILPLISYKHAVFLHDRVDGIAVPAPLRQALETADDPLKLCIRQSGRMLDLAREFFAGACVMPPFERFDILPEIL